MAEPTPPKLPEVKRAPLSLDIAPMAGQEEDALFKAQMAIANFFLGYWKQGLALVGAGLILALGIGQYVNHVRDVQRDAQAAIARMDKDMPVPDQLAMMGLAPLDDPADTARTAKLVRGAEGYEAIAKDSKGTGAVTAWLRAAEAWKRAGQPDRALAALQAADALGATDIVGWAVASNLAATKVDSGDVEGAIATLRVWSDRGNDLLNQQALVRIAELQEAAGRREEAAKTYEEFVNRFAESPLRDTVLRAQGRLRKTG